MKKRDKTQERTLCSLTPNKELIILKLKKMHVCLLKIFLSSRKERLFTAKHETLCAGKCFSLLHNRNKEDNEVEQVCKTSLTYS